jgi:hypothetical protein
MTDQELDKMEQRCSQYAIEHITGKGLHTGERWLKDEFNAYCEAINASDYERRHIVAQKIAINSIHALDHDQLQRLDMVLDDIAREPGQARGRRWSR